MSIVTLEGVVEQGQIKLTSNIQLPEKTKVYVIVPGLESGPIGRVVSPRLVQRDQAKDFKIQVIEEPSDAQL